MRGLEAEAGEKVIWKKHPGSYAGTDLQEWLDGEGVKKVVLVGYMVRVLVAEIDAACGYGGECRA